MIRLSYSACTVKIVSAAEEVCVWPGRNQNLIWQPSALRRFCRSTSTLFLVKWPSTSAPNSIVSQSRWAAVLTEKFHEFRELRRAVGNPNLPQSLHELSFCAIAERSASIPKQDLVNLLSFAFTAKRSLFLFLRPPNFIVVVHLICTTESRANVWAQKHVGPGIARRKSYVVAL